MIKMIELVQKDIKTFIMFVYHTFKKVEEKNERVKWRNRRYRKRPKLNFQRFKYNI